MDMQEFLGEFVIEAKENLDGIEGVLMDMERSGDPDSERINRAFRAIHSIKGAAGFLGLNRLADLSNAMESLLAVIRAGEMAPSVEAVDVLLSGVDLLHGMLDHIENEETFDISGLLSAIDDLLDARLRPEVNADLKETVPLRDAVNGKLPFRIDRFTQGNLPPGTDLFVLSFDLNVVADLDLLTPLALIDRLLDAGEILDGRLDVPADDLDGDLGEMPLLYELLYASSGSESSFRDMAPAGLRNVLRVETDAGRAEPCVPAGREAPPGDGEDKPAAPPAVLEEDLSSIRISADKIDALVTLAGEFLTVQASLMAEAKAMDQPRILAIAEQVERLSRDFRDVALAVRMVPIHTAFGRFRRLIRDLSRKQGKDATLATRGGATELDRTVIERLYDPLTHIIRNSIDHGIESPEVRSARGKPAQGTISVAASQRGGKVAIEIADDGAGLDPERIRDKAVASGLLSPDEKIDRSALLPLIFSPGLSTAESVTELSGRGVGMDVVKRRVEALQGDVTVESREGLGTTLRLTIPMSMAIIDGLLVAIDGVRYVIPQPEELTFVDLRGEVLARARSRNAMDYKGNLIPYICVRKFLADPGDLADAEYGVVVQKGEERVGLGVDRVIGFHQTIIKPLGKAYRDMKLFSGSSILGDGTVALILDVQHLIQEFRRKTG